MALVLTRPGSAGIPGLAISTINGQEILTLEDPSRGNKKLSVGEQDLTYSEATLSDLDWIEIGTASDADSGYIADFDGTIVYGTGHCEDTGPNSKNIHLFINGVDNGSIGTLAGGVNATFNNNLLDLDFSQGDKLRLRAVGPSGAIQDTVVKVSIKWRGP